MKKIILGVAAAAMTLAATAASAQAYGDYGRQGAYNRSYDSDRDGRPDSREWNRDRDRDGRPDQYDRNDRRGDRYQNGGQRWRQGQVYPNYRQRSYVIDNYRAYRLPPPRPGYRYYRSDNGDVVMAAIATGIIGLILGGALNDNGGGYNGYDGGYNNGGYNNGYRY